MLRSLKDAFPAEVGNMLLKAFAMDGFVKNLLDSWIFEPTRFGEAVQRTCGILQVSVEVPMVVWMLRAIGSIEGENLHT